MARQGIVEWYTGKDVFITGATGFLGKVLVEKLLRVVPDIGLIYLVVRGKRGLNSTERWKEVTNNPLYDVLKEMRPNALDKVVVMEGDVSQINLGMSEEDIKIIQERVSIVFHTAASVRFDDSLSKAVLLNTRGTAELIKIARNMPKLEVFEYVSTTYCNSNLDGKIDEKVYNQFHDWRALVKAIEDDSTAMNIIERKVMRDHPNTYTLTKSLAEIVVEEVCEELPTVIVRPSVVVGCIYEPIPGWVDNLNGVLGVTCGVSKGVLRVFRADPQASLDYVSADTVINAMITSAWKRARMGKCEKQLVYNLAYKDVAACSFDDIVKYGVIVNHSTPMDNNIWYPFMILTANTYYYHLLFYFLQFLPALLLDGLLLLTRNKPILMQLNIKIYLAAQALSSFTVKVFSFDNNNLLALNEALSEKEKQIFKLMPTEELNMIEMAFLFQQGARKYLKQLQEKEKDPKVLLAKHWRLYYIAQATKVLFLGLAAYWAYKLFLRFF